VLDLSRRFELLTIITLASVVGLASMLVPTGALLAWFALIVTANVLHRRNRAMARCCSYGALASVLVALAPYVIVPAVAYVLVTSRQHA
jgi:hypothetical protein